MTPKLDLHIHTTFSDGTDTPAMLLEQVRRAGLGLFSVTDHDAIGASLEVLALRRTGDPAFLTGVEFSCMDAEGRYHILGYGYDPAGASIGALAERCHRWRLDKVRSRLEGLRQYGITFPAQEVERLMSLHNPGKPHIANLMVAYGFADTREQAIGDVLNHIHVRGPKIPPETILEGICGSGGVAVLAHPAFGSGRERLTEGEVERRVRRLMDMGLRGLECYYSGFDRALSARMRSLAERLGLYVTAGSDYHGKNKPVLLGSTGLEAGMDWPEGLRAFLAAVGATHGADSPYPGP